MKYLYESCKPLKYMPPRVWEQGCIDQAVCAVCPCVCWGCNLVGKKSRRRTADVDGRCKNIVGVAFKLHRYLCLFEYDFIKVYQYIALWPSHVLKSMSDSGELGGKLLMLGNVSGTVLNGTLYANERTVVFISSVYYINFSLQLPTIRTKRSLLNKSKN